MFSSSKYPQVVYLYLALAFFSIPHLIDDFLFDIPLEFGISNRTAQFFQDFLSFSLLGSCSRLWKETRVDCMERFLWGSFLPWPES